MPNELITNMLVVIGESFWVFGAYAQLRALMTTHDHRGLSPVTQVLNAAGYVAWLTYFVTNHLWFPVVTNVVVLALVLGILYYVLTDHTLYRRALLAIAVIGPLTSVLLVSFPAISGWLGVVYNVIAATPWLVHVLRTKKLSGISVRSLWLDQVAMGCTLTYALLIGSVPLVAGCTQGFIFTWIILYRRHKFVH